VSQRISYPIAHEGDFHDAWDEFVTGLRPWLLGAFPCAAAIALLYAWNPFRTPALNPIARLAGIEFIVVETDAVAPALRRGRSFVSSDWAYAVGNPQKGDLVVFRPPGEAARSYVRRVVAVAGARVEIEGCRVRVDGRAVAGLRASAQGAAAAGESYSLLVPKGSYFLLSDRCAAGPDSRDWGAVPGSSIYGRVAGARR
jgi:signal peptidase I